MKGIMDSAALNTLTSDTALIGALLSHFSDNPRQQAKLLIHCENLEGKKLTHKTARIGLFDQLSIIGEMAELRGPYWALQAPDFWDIAMNNIFCSAVTSAPSLADSLDILAKYGYLWSKALYFEKFETPQHTTIAIETIALPSSLPIVHTGLQSLKRLALMAVYNLLDDNLQGVWNKTQIWTSDSPDMIRAFKTFSASPLIDDKQRTAIRFPAEFLSRSTQNSDPVKFRKLILQIENLINPRQNERSTMEIVSTVLDASHNHRPTLGEVSKSLGMSARTLNRRLEENGTSFRQLLDASLKKRALIYLAQPNISRGEISERLGYKDQASFSRALQRWNIG